MLKRKIAVIVGSVRKESFNLKMAKVLIGLAPDSFSMELVEIGQLPLYNQDLDDAPPAPWTDFREKMKKFEAVLFLTPEYNRGIPAAIKNAIDVGSRPHGKSIWNGLPAAVVSVAPGLLGAFGANHILRQSLVYLNMPTMPQPEAYISNARTLFSEDGKIINADTIEFLKKFIDAFAEWVETNAKKKV